GRGHRARALRVARDRARAWRVDRRGEHRGQGQPVLDILACVSVHRGRILIVDDDRAMCDLLEEGLGRERFETVARTSADDAPLALGAERFDAVLADLNMRGMSGLALCERIAANRPDVPVIV